MCDAASISLPRALGTHRLLPLLHHDGEVEVAVRLGKSPLVHSAELAHMDKDNIRKRRVGHRRELRQGQVHALVNSRQVELEGQSRGRRQRLLNPLHPLLFPPPAGRTFDHCEPHPERPGGLGHGVSEDTRKRTNPSNKTKPTTFFVAGKHWQRPVLVASLLVLFE